MKLDCHKQVGSHSFVILCVLFVSASQRGAKYRASSLSADLARSPFRKSISSVLNKDEPPKVRAYSSVPLFIDIESGCRCHVRVYVVVTSCCCSNVT